MYYYKEMTMVEKTPEAETPEAVDAPNAVPVHVAISNIIAELKGIAKAGRNKDQNYAFRGIEHVLTALHPLFAKHGVFFAPNVLSIEHEERKAKSGAIGHTTYLHVAYRVYGPLGDYIEMSTVGEGSDYSDKATNKAMTAAFKYAMFELFAIADPTEDGDTETPESSEKVSRREAAENGGAEADENGEAIDTRPPLTPLQEEVKGHPKIGSYSGPTLTAFITDAIGYENPGLRALTDEDCEKILAKWRD